MKRVLVLLLMFGTSTAWADLYTWRDNRGADHFTNNLDEIPARYLKKARIWDVATGKRGKLVTAAPAGGQAAPATAPSVASPAPVPVNPPAPTAAPAPAPPQPSPAPAPTNVRPAPAASALPAAGNRRNLPSTRRHRAPHLPGGSREE